MIFDLGGSQPKARRIRVDAIPPAPAGATNVRIVTDNPTDSHLEDLREEVEALTSTIGRDIKRNGIKEPRDCPELSTIVSLAQDKTDVHLFPEGRINPLGPQYERFTRRSANFFLVTTRAPRCGSASGR
jgi:hypothetical protein